MDKILRKEVAIGLSVIVALAVLFFGINYLKGINMFKAANYYYVSYTNVEGLAVSAPVTLNGLKVGLVREMEYEYDNPGHVKVEISLDKQVKVPQGSKAQLVLGLLGTATIDLQLSDSDQYQEIGSTIIGDNKASMLDAVGNTVMPAIDQIMPKIDTLLTNINMLTGHPALLASMERLNAITADLQKTASNLAAVTSQLSPIAADVRNITGNVSTLTSDLAEVSGELKQMPLEKITNDLQTTIQNLKTLSGDLSNPNSSLGKLTHDPALYDNINATVQSLDSLFVDIKKNPKRYVTIKVF